MARVLTRGIADATAASRATIEFEASRSVLNGGRCNFTMQEDTARAACVTHGHPRPPGSMAPPLLCLRACDAGDDFPGPRLECHT